MKTRHLYIIAAAVVSACCLFTGCKREGINDLPPEQIREMTARAYIMGYPLVMNYATMYRQVIDTAAPEYLGGFGKIRHYGFATPDNFDIVSPNNDTPYSWAWVDLRTEPWVLVMPPVDEGRYYTSQWDDLWGFVLDSPGSVFDGQGGGTYLIAPADWEGDIPAGIKRVIRSESRFAGGLFRTGADGPDDLPAVEAVQAGYKVMPLHEYLGQPAPPAVESIEWIPFVSGDEATIEAFKYVNFMLPYTIPNEMDKPALEKMAQLGIAAGESWDTSKFSPAVKEAIKAGISDAMKSLGAYMSTAKSADLFNTREIMGTDYIARALGVQVGIFGNYASQAVYFGLNTDADGNEIDTSAADYKISFPAGGTPPARYFWSITMYSLPDRFLVANPLERYSFY